MSTNLRGYGDIERVKEDGNASPYRPYKPYRLGWCKSYKQEVEAFHYLIGQRPDDERLLRDEYREFTGKRFKSKR